MRRRIIAAAIQLTAHDRASCSAAWPAIAAQIGAAAARGANLVALPEGTLPAYVLGPERFENAEIAAALKSCAELARELRIVLVVGAARADAGRVFNSAIVFDRDGTVAGSADKYFLWHFDRQWFTPGEQLQPIQTSLGSLGVLICADGRIPTIARALVDRGAEVLVMPTAWVTSGRDADNLENIQADLLARIRARENGVPFVAANKCGVELGCVAYCGKSQIVNADGSPAALAPQDRPQTIVAEIELGGAQPMRTQPRGSIAAHVAPATAPVRVALSARPAGDGRREQLAILEAQVLIAPDTLEHAAQWPLRAIIADDAIVHDPGGLALPRLAGVDFAIWRTSGDAAWQLSFARARAVELRMYVAVLDLDAARAYAVDPDGAVVCGTYGEYQTAGFTYDPARTRQTIVAPGTDVREGLERAHAAIR